MDCMLKDFTVENCSVDIGFEFMNPVDGKYLSGRSGRIRAYHIKELVDKYFKSIFSGFRVRLKEGNMHHFYGFWFEITGDYNDKERLKEIIARELGRVRVHYKDDLEEVIVPGVTEYLKRKGVNDLVVAIRSKPDKIITRRVKESKSKTPEGLLTRTDNLLNLEKINYRQISYSPIISDSKNLLSPLFEEKSL